ICMLGTILKEKRPLLKFAITFAQATLMFGSFFFVPAAIGLAVKELVGDTKRAYTLIAQAAYWLWIPAWIAQCYVDMNGFKNWRGDGWLRIAIGILGYGVLFHIYDTVSVQQKYSTAIALVAIVVTVYLVTYFVERFSARRVARNAQS
ncbi:MAG: hypothetical protein ABI579_06350, partial [Candidatus Sumerlaeota bacterium]